MSQESPFWFHLIRISEAVAEIDPASGQAEEQLVAQLETLDEVYGRAFDPVDEFEQYAALALCNSLRRVLTARQSRQAEPNL